MGENNKRPVGYVAKTSATGCDCCECPAPPEDLRECRFCGATLCDGCLMGEDDPCPVCEERRER